MISKEALIYIMHLIHISFSHGKQISATAGHLPMVNSHSNLRQTTPNLQATNLKSIHFSCISFYSSDLLDTLPYTLDFRN